ncbi:MAG: class I SAM-dependent methyltransferase [Candidatus Omnitrophica bacterium]|nr:class I SAM-dependent methyltransferase [Candidatus Omnitrophota bacterium]
MKEDVKEWIELDGVKFLQEIGLKKGQVVLDFGSGKGHYTIPASKAVGRDGKVYALDNDRGVLDKLKRLIQQEKIKNIEVISESSKVPLDDESVDVVLCYDVIHYGNRKERKAVYSEVYRALKREGLFSVYPKHYKKDHPLMELANIDLDRIIEEVEETGFILQHKFSKRLLHDEYYNEGHILNFRKC